MVELAVVIVNYRTPKFINACLSGLLMELDGLDAVVVVVDNCSGDDSVTQIRHWLVEHDVAKKVVLIESLSNLGFAGGNNIGIKAVRSNYYLLLNSDTLICPGAIKMLVETMLRFHQVGLVSPRLEWPNGDGQESCFRYHSPCSELIAAGQTGLLDQLFGRFVVPLPVQSGIAFPQWTSFACVLIKDDVFQQIGLLDEGYFMYFEDVEFCRRARHAGWEIVHNPEARVVHLRGASSSLKEQVRLKKRLPRRFYEARTRYFYQAYGWLGLTTANFMWWLGRLVSGTRQLLGRQDKAAIEGEWLDIWTNWLHPLKSYTLPQSK